MKSNKSDMNGEKVLNKKRKRYIKNKCLLFNVFVIMLLTMLSYVACAEETQSLAVKIDSYDDTSVSYTISGESEYESAYVMSAAYLNGRMVDLNTKLFSFGEDDRTVEDTFSDNFDCVKVFLLDTESLSPICKNASTNETYTVLFRYEDGTVVSEQNIRWGESALLPDSPEKAGYIFQGWEGNYISVKENSSVVAQFVKEDADNIFAVTGASGKKGDLITVSVDLLGNVSLCGFDMRLYYDSNCLEYVSMDSEFAFDLLANHVESSNSIRFNFSSTKNKTSGGTVLQATFRIKDTADYDSVLKLQPIDVFEADTEIAGKLIDSEHTVTEGVVFVDEE